MQFLYYYIADSLVVGGWMANEKGKEDHQRVINAPTGTTAIKGMNREREKLKRSERLLEGEQLLFM